MPDFDQTNSPVSTKLASGVVNGEELSRVMFELPRCNAKAGEDEELSGPQE
jgi:hypothetical protein